MGEGDDSDKGQAGDQKEKVDVCICTSEGCMLTDFCCCSVFKLQAGETALHVTARYGHPDVLAHLVAVGGSVDIQDKVML